MRRRSAAEAAVRTLNTELEAKVAARTAELAERAKAWKPRESEFGSGYLWKYSQQVGPARDGAVTHPGGSAEKVCYADI